LENFFGELGDQIVILGAESAIFAVMLPLVFKEEFYSLLYIFPNVFIIIEML
jgi:hypothetical protein